MSIRSKLLACFGLLAALLLANVAWVVVSSRQVETTMRQSDRVGDALLGVKDTLLWIRQVRVMSLGYLGTGDESYIPRRDDAFEQLKTVYNRVRAAPLPAEGLGLLDDYMNSLVAFRNDSVRMNELKAKGLTAQDPDMAAILKAVDQDAVVYAGTSAKVQKYMVALNDGITADVYSRVGTSNTILMVTSGLIVLLSALFSWLLSRAIATPVQDISGVIGTLAKGETAVTVPHLARGDEIGAMAQSVETLRGVLHEAHVARDAQAARVADEHRLIARRQSLAQAFVSRMQDLASGFARSSNEVADSARNLSSTAEETARQAQSVAHAAETAATNVQTVAASSEELAASVREITQQVSHSADVADVAFKEAESSNVRIADLSHAATAIGDVLSLIKGIADQTNLLALNATIEAARAGDAGRGFAVVASEVKELAAQTAKATTDISEKINEIQHATNGTVTSMGEIVRMVSNIKSISSSIASAVEEQGAATGEIAVNCQLAATGTQHVTENIGGVDRSAQITGAASQQLLSLSQSLSGQAIDLGTVVETFVRDLDAA
ncbi:methyl-accepting chemotaxis protein [Azorhizobium sp. AG788]|uniref:methyl-accepting chemotaxis protein n=1 Tax=Azorhizobium sp. AG788 TaxID=2183897 RepID=UPI003138D95F